MAHADRSGPPAAGDADRVRTRFRRVAVHLYAVLSGVTKQGYKRRERLLKGRLQKTVTECRSKDVRILS